MRILTIVGLLFVGMSTFSAPSYACQLNDTSGLTEVQKQQILAACNTAKAETAANGGATVVENVTPEQISQWSELAAGISEALVTAAKGLGVAANELLDSPVGYLIVGVIMWKVMGSVFIGTAMLFFVNLIGFKVLRMVRSKQARDEDDNPMFNDKGKPVMVLTPITWVDGRGDQTANVLACIILAAMALGSFISFMVM